MIGIIILVFVVNPLTRPLLVAKASLLPQAEGGQAHLVVLLDHSCLYHSPGKT